MSACRNDDKERVMLSYDEALKIIKDGEHVHTFRAAGIALVGCDWERNKLLETMKKYEHTLELTGKVATSITTVPKQPSRISKCFNCLYNCTLFSRL